MNSTIYTEYMYTLQLITRINRLIIHFNIVIYVKQYIPNVFINRLITYLEQKFIQSLNFYPIKPIISLSNQLINLFKYFLKLIS